MTLDTTRADAIGPDAMGITTASFNAVAARGRRFRQAYATVPETLPSHASLMTGLYPAGHGIHENARRLPDATPVLAEQLKGAGYRTAAVVASFVLAKQFGLARGFDVYDDRLPEGRQDRTASEVTEAAMTALEGGADAPLFLWVHYWDPHHPYTPPEPFRIAHPASPYLGEVAYMDAELGRLVDAFERRAKAADGHHHRRRPRRGTRRPRRIAAREPALPVDDARAARGGRPRGDGGHRRDARQHPPRLSHGARLRRPRMRPTA